MGRNRWGETQRLVPDEPVFIMGIYDNTLVMDTTDSNHI
jgi:hypothetical protein